MSWPFKFAWTEKGTKTFCLTQLCFRSMSVVKKPVLLTETGGRRCRETLRTEIVKVRGKDAELLFEDDQGFLGWKQTTQLRPSIAIIVLTVGIHQQRWKLNFTVKKILNFCSLITRFFRCEIRIKKMGKVTFIKKMSFFHVLFQQYIIMLNQWGAFSAQSPWFDFLITF